MLSLATITRGTGTAVFAVFGLYTIVFNVSNSFGADPLASRASRQLAASVAPWFTTAAGRIANVARDSVMLSTEAIVAVVVARGR